MTLGEVLAGLHGMAEIPGMPDLAEMPPDGFTFQIPPCQRPYCWKLSDIEHVLADVADMRSAESTTLWYFGPICFRRDKDVMQIYDGQQRLTSMLLVVSVLAERLQADGANLGLSEEQAERLRSAAEGAARFSYERPATVDAIMLMAERLRNRFGVNRTAEAAQFDVREDAKRVVWMLDHVFFSATVLRSDIEAAQYFQGENNRGASMQLVDLVKSLNLRFVPEADLEKYAALWTNLAEQRTRGTFQGSDAVERVLLPSMLIVRGLWTFEAEANDADDYKRRYVWPVLGLSGRAVWDHALGREGLIEEAGERFWMSANRFSHGAPQWTMIALKPQEERIADRREMIGRTLLLAVLVLSLTAAAGFAAIRPLSRSMRRLRGDLDEASYGTRHARDDAGIGPRGVSRVPEGLQGASRKARRPQAAA